MSQQTEIEKKMMEEVSDLMGKHMSGLTAGALKKRLELVDILEKEVENLKIKITSQDSIIESQNKTNEILTNEIKSLEANKNKEAILAKKEEELTRKEWELNKEKEFSTKEIEFFKESKKEMFDIVKTVVGGPVKTHSISRLFNETPIFGPDGQPAIKKDCEITDAKTVG